MRRFCVRLRILESATAKYNRQSVKVSSEKAFNYNEKVFSEYLTVGHSYFIIKLDLELSVFTNYEI